MHLLICLMPCSCYAIHTNNSLLNYIEYIYVYICELYVEYGNIITNEVKLAGEFCESPLSWTGAPVGLLSLLRSRPGGATSTSAASRFPAFSSTCQIPLEYSQLIVLPRISITSGSSGVSSINNLYEIGHQAEWIGRLHPNLAGHKIRTAGFKPWSSQIKMYTCHYYLA